MSLHQAPDGMLALPANYLQQDDLDLDLEFEEFLHGTPPTSSSISYSGLSSANSTAEMISSTIFAAGSSHQAANFLPSTESTRPTVPRLDQPNLLHLLGQKRTADSIVGPAKTKQRKIRTCAKCHDPKCPGKRGHPGDCKGKCADCGRFECRGRNSKKPDKRCSEGWL